MLLNKEEILTQGNHICACADFSELQKIRGFVYEKAQIFGFDENDSSKIMLAVDEACTNLIEHSFKFDKSKEFCVDVEITKSKFTIKILDNGNPFNPLLVSNTDMKEYFKGYKKGGLGIQIIRSVMDEISYQSSDTNNPDNVLTLTKIRYY